MFEPFVAARLSAKLLNLLLLLIILLAWIGSCVGFGAELARVTQPLPPLGTVVFKIYYDHINSPRGNDSIRDIDEGCYGSGKAFVAMLVFAFLILFLAFPIMFARIAGFRFPKIDNTQQSLKYEWVLLSIATLFYILAVSIWGGACFAVLPNSRGYSKLATGFASLFASKVINISEMHHGHVMEFNFGAGYAYIIFCSFILLIGSVLAFLQKRNPNLQVGNDDSGVGRSPILGESDYVSTTGPQADYSYQGASYQQTSL